MQRANRLCTIGKNAWYKERKRRNRLEPEPVDTIPVPTPGPEDALLRREQYDRTRRAIWNLPEPYKTVVILHLYGEQTLREIAAAQEKSESWARVTYYRARQMILQEVQP